MKRTIWSVNYIKLSNCFMTGTRVHRKWQTQKAERLLLLLLLELHEFTIYPFRSSVHWNSESQNEATTL
jgi:hypothetical protein